MRIMTNETIDAAQIPLADIARIRTRYLRSVNIERDFYGTETPDDYILTPASLVSLERIAAGIRQPSARAFSITGPYGSGKSAFALFAAKILAPAPLTATFLRTQIQSQDPEIAGRLLGEDAAAGYWPILITGGREPLASALVRGLRQSFYHLPEIASRAVLRKLSKEWHPVLEAEHPTAHSVTDLFIAASILIKKHHPASKGLVVVVDELGKFLEYAALHPERGDMQVLQELAECAARSLEIPLFLLTILHQAFEEYSHKLSPQQRQEWQKVQGRFVDIPFEDGAEEKVRLLARAIEQQDNLEAQDLLDQIADQHLSDCQRLSLMPKSLTGGEFRHVLRQTYPLHPLTVLVAPHLFRRFGQNERSLFSFLSSEEPHGFQDFLRSHSLTAWDAPFLRLDHLYDYVVATLGSSLYSHPTSKLWSETEDALYRVADKPPVQSRLVKTIGLLHILGEQTRISPSKDVLRFALSEEAGADDAVDEAIAALESSTLITYRRFKGAYRLYEGSDIDVDARLREARSHFSQGTDAIRLAGRLEANPPIVARRHSYDMGTLRSFEVRCCRPAAIETEILAGQRRSDGLLVLCLASHRGEVADAERRLQEFLPDHPDVVVGLNVETDALHESAVAVECLLWVQSETPALSKDRVASREVRERLLDATAAFQNEWERLLRPQRVTESSSWFYHGQREPVTSYRKLQELLSRACGEAFPDTPRLRNELINRRQLSGAAAAARRNLIAAMIARREQPRLGITGYPPERSMYASLLESTGIHRPVQAGPHAETEEWGIFPPRPDEDPSRAYA